MRGVILAVLAIAVMSAAVIPIQGTEADTPARLYFFDDDNVCIKEIILLPGEPIKGADIPPSVSGKSWYDDDATFVRDKVTFSSGDHIIRQYSDSNPPRAVQQEPDYTLVIIAGTVIVVSIIGLVAYLFIFKK